MYSPEVAPSDFHEFTFIKTHISGKRFASDEEVKRAVHGWRWSGRSGCTKTYPTEMNRAQQKLC